MIKRKSVLSSGVLAAFALISGCSSTENGSASPATEIATSSPRVSQHSDRHPSPDAEDNADSLDSCTLLSPSEIATLGDFDEPRRIDLGGVRGCSFEPQNTGATRSPTINVGVRESQSVDSANDQGLGVTEATFNGRDAAQIPNTNGGCIIALALTDSSRVDVGVTGVDHEQACELVEQVAEIVEPKLPEQR